MLTLVLAWLTWQVRRELDPKVEDPALRGYLRLCHKLAAAGIPRLQHEGALDYARRVARERPDLQQPVTALCETYAALRYSAAPDSSPAAFEAAVRAFKAARMPRDSEPA
jgi:hypothetical protein